jgi:hypothetical protein
METKVFIFEQMGGALAELPASGSGNVKKFDEYRAEGWEPIHWENVSPQGTQNVRFRVIMEKRTKRKPIEGPVTVANTG